MRRIDPMLRRSFGEAGRLVRHDTLRDQVDVIIPENYRVLIEVGRQIYAAETIIAGKDEDTD